MKPARWWPGDLPDTTCRMSRAYGVWGPSSGLLIDAMLIRHPEEGWVKSAEEIMEILEAYDLTESYRDAGELAGCSHHTVAHYVAAREEGRLSPGRGCVPGGGVRASRL